jgi:hypothetical protein
MYHDVYREENSTFFFLHPYLAWNLSFQRSGIGYRVAIEIMFRKIPWNRLGTVLIIPRKKVLLSRNSMCLGIAHSEVQNRTEWEFHVKLRFDGTANIIITKRLSIDQKHQ